MRHARALQPMRGRFVRCAAILAAACLVGPACRAQEALPGGQTERPLFQDTGWLEQMGQFLTKLEGSVKFPAPRTESRLLPLLPPSTVLYAAIPNYGGAAKQALETFHQELEQNPALREMWQRGEMAATGPKVEKFLERFAQLHEYLGEEIVVSATFQGQPRLLAVAEVRKSGMREFVRQMAQELAGKSKPAVRVLDPVELAAAKEESPSEGLVVVVRPDFAVAAQDLATLRSFCARLDAGGDRELVSAPFGQRILQEYQGGLTILVAVDLQELVNQIPPPVRQDPIFQRTGFADLKHFVWAHKDVTGKAVSQSELSFTAARRGIPSWLAKSGPLGSLDFVSPKAMAAVTVALKDPAQIFDEVKELATLSNANAFAGLAQFERALELSLRDDLLGHLGGELTLELDSVAPPLPAWKAILGVKDAERLQQTLNTLLAAVPFPVQHAEDGGITYHTVRIPYSQTPIEIGYSLVDRYLVVGSSRDVVADAVRVHRSGESLGKSSKFLASLPPGHSQEASGLLYLDPMALTALQMRRLAPGVADSLLQSSVEMPPAVAFVDGQETAIQQSTTNPQLDVGVVLVVAAIAIPNLLRARITANETSAVGSLRSVNTAQQVYAATYPQRGFAPNLATLGPGAGGAGPATADHADLLDGLLADPSCTGDAWCTKSGYRFRVAGVCTQNRCEDYVVVATPITPNTTGIRSFCSTSHGVIRLTTETPSASSLSVAECTAWPPIQ